MAQGGAHGRGKAPLGAGDLSPEPPRSQLPRPSAAGGKLPRAGEGTARHHRLAAIYASCFGAFSAKSCLSEARTGRLKYLDEEGDLCTLTPDTFEDFMNLQGKEKVLRLTLVAAVPAERRQEDRSGGLKMLVMALHMLQSGGLLTPQMFASLAVQWLPLLTQRVARKVDKINHTARHGLDQAMRGMLERIQREVEGTVGLQHCGPAMKEALKGGGRLGESILDMLKALRCLSFEVQASFCETLASTVLPYLENLTGKCCETWCQGQDHLGCCCAGCGATPIVGPRFSCASCPGFNLCGNCYPQKNRLHKGCLSGEFQCIIFPQKLVKVEDACAAPSPEAWIEAMGSVFPAHTGFPCVPMASCMQPPFQQPLDYAALERTARLNAANFDWSSWWSQKNFGRGQLEKHKEFEQKVADLLGLQLANEEVVRQLLISHDGDLTQVLKVLTA